MRCASWSTHPDQNSGEEALGLTRRDESGRPRVLPRESDVTDDGARQPLDDRAVRYYQVFRAVAQLVPVGAARAAGRAGGGAFHSEAGACNLIALIRRLSGVSVRL